MMLRIRNSILGMASHDLSNTKAAILGAIPGIDGNPHERFAFALALLEHLFKSWGGAHAQHECQQKFENFVHASIFSVPCDSGNLPSKSVLIPGSCKCRFVLLLKGPFRDRCI